MELTLNEKTWKEIKKEINKINSEEIKNLILLFVESNEFKRYINSNITKKKHTRIIILSIIGLIEKFNKNEKTFNWNTYCKQMHEILKIKKNLDNPSYTANLLREVLSLFYKNIAVKNKQIKENLNLFIANETKEYNNDKIKLNDIAIERIRTNFPLYSLPDEILQLKIKLKNEMQIQNINLNTNNVVLKTILKEFIENMSEVDKTKLNKSIYRMFFYYFSEALKRNNRQIKEIKEFNEEVFKEQLRYINEMNKVHGFDKGKASMNGLLIKFYIFLDKKHEENNGEKLFNHVHFSRNMLLNNQYIKYVEEEYEMVVRNPLENFPKGDKWLLLSNDNVKTSNTYSVNNVTLDFSKIENTLFKEDLKKYIWFKNATDLSLKQIVVRIKDFLMELEKYNKTIRNIRKDNSLVSNDFLLGYKAKLYNRIESENAKSYVNTSLNSIKGFLQHYKEKYKINNLLLQQLKKTQSDYNGGNPMGDEDFKMISEEFVKRRSERNGELFLNIFKLATSTKLRLGEIINLQRDCIVGVDKEKRFGKIQFVSKTSNGEKVKDIFLIDDIEIIQNSIQITKDEELKALNNIKKYIFLLKSEVNPEYVVRITNQFKNHFNSIIEDLHRERKISKKYRPNNMRHTFINKAWESVEDNLISSIEIGTITGNTATIASRHYREYQTKRYIESTYMISIGDVNVNGEIIEKNDEIDDLPQVENGAGACKSDKCVKLDSDEDSNFKCLTCKKFVTSVARKEIFEEKLKNYTSRKNVAKSKIERDYFDGLSKLYATYLNNIYQLAEGVK